MIQFDLATDANMTKKPASPRMVYLLTRAEQRRKQAGVSPGPAMAEALHELALEFEAEAALQAGCDDVIDRRASSTNRPWHVGEIIMLLAAVINPVGRGTNYKRTDALGSALLKCRSTVTEEAVRLIAGLFIAHQEAGIAKMKGIP